MINIMLVDMHLRDERVYEHLRRNSPNGTIQISHDDIAKYLGCHRHTALAITRRLIAARLLVVENKTTRRGGYVYRLIHAE